MGGWNLILLTCFLEGFPAHTEDGAMLIVFLFFAVSLLQLLPCFFGPPRHDPLIYNAANRFRRVRNPVAGLPVELGPKTSSSRLIDRIECGFFFGAQLLS